jgi:protein involved in plasmid replication-relaxation
MTNNNQTNNQDTLASKRHNKLNAEQINILQFLYNFRFASNKQIARYQQKQNIRPVQNRLKILEDQALISKHYDKSYRLKGKPAAYYILPKGARALEANTTREPDEPINFRRIYKDKDVSEGFITHCSNILDIYLGLKTIFLNKRSFVFATKSKMNYEEYEYLPHPLPDAYIRFGSDEDPKQFFLDIFEERQPYFVLVRRIKSYFKYCSEGDWSDTGTDFPVVLIVCANTSVQKRLRRRLPKELQDSYDDIRFVTTTISEATTIDKTHAKVWLPMDEDGDDPDEPQQPVRLQDL